jgi:ABC-type ATPase involved in cell division
LQIEKASLNFIIGEIGSGKTAFLNALLNEMKNIFYEDNINNNEV